MQYVIYALIALSILSIESSAQSIQKPNPINEYRFKSGTIVCLTDSSWENPYPCLHIGPIYIGRELEKVIERFGDPFLHQRSYSDSNMVVSFFKLRSEGNKQTNLAITTNLFGIIQVIQLTGEIPIKSLSFSSINIGDSEKKVIKILGQPSARQPGDRSVHWAFASQSFAFEMVDGKVETIVIWRPLYGRF